MKYFVQLSLAAMFCLSAFEHARGAQSYPYSGGFDDYCTLTKSDIHYTAAQATYKMWGFCRMSADDRYPYDFAAQGGYRSKDGFVTEIFTLTLNSWKPEPHPIKLQKFCKSDPWITTAQCNQPQVTGDAFAGVDGSIANILLNLAVKSGGPLTVYFNYPRGPLLAQRDRELKAEADAIAKEAARKLQQASQPVSYLANLMPIVQSPVAGQRFYNQTVVPIKLAPPPQWPQTNVDIQTGAAVTTAKSVQSYMVNIWRKSQRTGQWVNMATIPIGAVNAHSQGGYTGFVPGVPPTAGPEPAPGAWRLRAQVSSPHQTGWSDWVEFNVMTPPTSTNVLKPGVGFGKK